MIWAFDRVWDAIWAFKGLFEKVLCWQGPFCKITGASLHILNKQRGLYAKEVFSVTCGVTLRNFNN